MRCAVRAVELNKIARTQISQDFTPWKLPTVEGLVNLRENR
jgi:hypothetical protein